MRQFFEDSLGRLSSSRLIFIIGSAWNLLISSYLLISGKEPTSVLAFFSGVQGVLSGTKLVQKNIEHKTIK